MKLLFLLLLCVLILAGSARSPSFDVRLHGSSSIPIASFVERSLFTKTFCHRKYLKGHRQPQVFAGVQAIGAIFCNTETSIS